MKTLNKTDRAIFVLSVTNRPIINKQYGVTLRRITWILANILVICVNTLARQELLSLTTETNIISLFVHEIPISKLEI